MPSLLKTGGCKVKQNILSVTPFRIFCFRLSILDLLEEGTTWGPAFLIKVPVLEPHRDVRTVTKSLYVHADKIISHILIIS